MSIKRVNWKCWRIITILADRMLVSWRSESKNEWVNIMGFQALYCYEFFKLKIKFSFYDLPCSFPIKHSVFVLFCSFFLSIFLVQIHLSLSLAHKRIFLPLVVSSWFHLFIRPFAVSDYFSFSRAHKCSNSWRCHGKIKKSCTRMFDWPKFLGANHICNYEIKDKQTETRSAYNNNNLCMHSDWIRRKNKRMMRK